MPKDFILEIGCEEIPAGYTGPALESLAAEMTRFLDQSRLAHGPAETAGTPRRLALCVRAVAEAQEPCTTEVMGPPKAAGFDREGRPTKAAEGFARGQGVAVSALTVKTTPKGEYLCAVKEEAGEPALALLSRALPDFVARVPFPKTMRWGSLPATFARPVFNIVALFGGDIIPFAFGDIQSGAASFGHRLMSPGPIAVTSWDSLKADLRERRVILDREERKALVRGRAAEAAARVGGRILPDEDLLDEVTNLVEWPHALLGAFEEKYLALPPELLITVMKAHQRYFAVVDDAGALRNCFVTIANTVPRDDAVVAAGNARVIRARLEDARFYHEDDMAVPLSERAESLKNVVFHRLLGTSWEKIERFTRLAAWLAGRLSPGDLPVVLRAAHLCKADLVSGVVGEFPELQGIMGGHIARRQGEPEAVAVAIREHYMPLRAGGEAPQSLPGAILSLADKIDTIVSCFGVGLIPSGTADPFALRRQTLGVIRIILERNLAVSLGDLVSEALPALSARLAAPPEDVRRAVLDFFAGRLENMLAPAFGADVVSAALAAGADDLVQAVARVKALHEFRQRLDFEALATAVKRVQNIVKEPERAPIEPALFRHEAEEALYDELLAVEGIVAISLLHFNYTEALEAMADLRDSIDAFFASVLVMEKDEAVRRNRLALLTRIGDLFAAVADFRKIQTAAGA